MGARCCTARGGLPLGTLRKRLPQGHSVKKNAEWRYAWRSATRRKPRWVGRWDPALGWGNSRATQRYDRNDCSCAVEAYRDVWINCLNEQLATGLPVKRPLQNFCCSKKHAADGRRRRQALTIGRPDRSVPEWNDVLSGLLGFSLVVTESTFMFQILFSFLFQMVSLYT